MNIKIVLLALGVALIGCGGGGNPPTTTTVLWHAGFEDSKIRGYGKSQWGSGNAGNAQTMLSLSACNNAKPNDIIQLENNDLIITDNPNNRLLRIRASVFASRGSITLTAAQCEVLDLQTTPIGLAKDSVGQSFFVASNISLKRYDLVNGNYTLAQTMAGNNFSGLTVAGNKLYAVDFGNNKVRVYDLAANTRTMTEIGTFTPDGFPLVLAEGIAVAGNTLFLADNSENMGNYRIFGFPVATVNAISGGGNTIIAPSKQISHGNNTTESFVRCPGGLATDPDGNLWVNVQGSSSPSSNCGSNATPAGNVSKYTVAQLADSSITTAPSVQLTGVATVPGYGGLFFGK